MNNKLKFYYFDGTFLTQDDSYVKSKLRYIAMAIGIRVYDFSELMNLQLQDSNEEYIQKVLNLTKEEIDGLKALYTDYISIIVKRAILLKKEDVLKYFNKLPDEEKIEKIRKEQIIKVKWK